MRLCGHGTRRSIVRLPLQVGWLRRQLRVSVLDAERQCARLGTRAGAWA